MSQVVTQRLQVTDTITETIALGQIQSPIEGTKQTILDYTNGTGAAAIDLHWEKVGVTLAASGTVTYTLSALSDDQGRTVAFARVDKLVIAITSKTGTDYLTIGNAASHDWTAIVGATTEVFVVRGLEIKASQDATGFVVTSSSSDQLKITNSGSNPVTFDIRISGRHS